MNADTASDDATAFTARRVKVLRTRAEVALQGGTLVARADKLASHGVSLMVPRSARPQESCVVRMKLLVNGDLRRVSATGCVVSCCCVGMEGFRIAVRFSDMDEESATAIASLLAEARAAH